MISPATIERIRERANLVEIISESVALKRQGSGYSGLCPFHAEKTPSFHVRGDGSSYHCFGCGASGNAISYLMQTRGVSFPEAVEELAQRYNITVERTGGKKESAPTASREQIFGLNALAQKFFTDSLSRAEKLVQEYVKRRGLTRESLAAFGVGFCPRSWRALFDFLKSMGVSEELMLRSGLCRRSSRGELYDTLRGRLIFPVWLDSRRIAGFGGRIVPGLDEDSEHKGAPKYLNSPESPVYQKHKILYGLPQAADSMRSNGEVYVVEGYLDVIGLWQQGVKNAVATCGTAATEDHAQRLGRLVRRANILFDGDNAGRVAAARCFGVFLNSGLDAQAIFLPQDTDPDSFAAQHGSQISLELGKLPRRSLFDCYLEGLIARFGGESGELGAAAKGKLCEELMQLLHKVRNNVERSELVKRAAFRLQLEVEALKVLALKQAGGMRAVPIDVDASGSAESGAEALVFKSIPQLSELDRQVLSCIMADRERLPQSLLLDPELCMMLDPVTLGFVEQLDDLVSDQGLTADARRERIRELLQACGESWVKHWKAAYRMAAAGEVDFERQLEECRRSARKRQLNQEVAEIDRRIAQCSDETEKLALLQQKLQLTRRAQELPTAGLIDA